jgi:hypothetical protein
MIYMNTPPPPTRLLTRIVIVFFILITTHCGTGCKKDDKVDKRPDITPNLLEAAHSDYILHTLLLDLKAGKSVNINKKDRPIEVTFLQRAISIGNEELVKFLLKEGADVNLEGGLSLDSPLLYAVDRIDYNLPIIKLLLAQPNIDKEKKDKYFNHTALFKAIQRAYPDVVQALLDAGVNYTTPIDGRTPYSFALDQVTNRYIDKKEERRKIVAILQAKGSPYY